MVSNYWILLVLSLVIQGFLELLASFLSFLAKKDTLQRDGRRDVVEAFLSFNSSSPVIDGPVSRLPNEEASLCLPCWSLSRSRL